MTAPNRGAKGEANGFARLSEIVRTAIRGEVSEDASVAGRERCLKDFRRQRRHRRNATVALGGASMLAAGAAAAQLCQTTTIPSRAETRAYGNGYVSGGGANPTVRFASGPVVEFAVDGRGRVGDLGAARARVVLEGGRARVHDGAGAQEDFLVEAGPYALKSDRAAFDVSWSGNVLEVHVASGAVMVEGPEARQGVVVHEDQAFVARESGGETRCF